MRSLLQEIGLESDRVRMYNLSSGEAPTFVAYAKEMTENIQKLGPNPLKKKPRANSRDGVDDLFGGVNASYLLKGFEVSRVRADLKQGFYVSL